MTWTPLTRRRGIGIARQFKHAVEQAGIPILGVYLFGSLSKGETHRWSDVDIAVIYRPFATSRMEEHRMIRRQRTRFDVPMDIVCLHPNDLEKRYWRVAQEVQKHGISV